MLGNCLSILMVPPTGLDNYCSPDESFIFVSEVSFNQTNDTFTIYHKYSSTTFSTSKHYPVVVPYWLTRSMLNSKHRFKRLKRFMPDPLLSQYAHLDRDYKHSGYDRGHQMDAFSCGCDSVQWHSVSEWLLSESRKTS